MLVKQWEKLLNIDIDKYSSENLICVVISILNCFNYKCGNFYEEDDTSERHCLFMPDLEFNRTVPLTL